MLVDNFHTKNKIVKRHIIRVRLDNDCSFCVDNFKKISKNM